MLTYFKNFKPKAPTFTVLVSFEKLAGKDYKLAGVEKATEYNDNTSGLIFHIAGSNEEFYITVDNLAA